MLKLESSVHYLVPSGLSQNLIMTQANVACFQIERLRIGHDSKGDGKGIFVEEVEVAPADGDRAIFPCYCWLTEGKGDKKIERDVLPGQPRPPRPSKCYYDNCCFRLKLVVIWSCHLSLERIELLLDRVNKQLFLITGIFRFKFKNPVPMTLLYIDLCCVCS